MVKLAKDFHRISEGLKDVETTNLGRLHRCWFDPQQVFHAKERERSSTFLGIGFQAGSQWLGRAWVALGLFYFPAWYLLFLISPTYWNTHQCCHCQQNLHSCVDPRIVSFTQIIGHCCVKERAAPQAVITNLSMHLVRSEVVGNLDSSFWEALSVSVGGEPKLPRHRLTLWALSLIYPIISHPRSFQIFSLF